MADPAAPSLIPEMAERPTSVVVHGSSRPLLNWVMYALLVRADPNFIWTDIRLSEEVLDPLDPLARHLVPERQLSVIRPEDLRRNPGPRSGVSSTIHPEESDELKERLLNFLRLPEHTQDLISRAPGKGRVPAFGLSNAHRVAALFPPESIRPTLAAISSSGISLVMTWGDAVPGSSRAFDFRLGVEGEGPHRRKDAILRCELGTSSGRVRVGERLRLGDLPAVAEVLGPFGLTRT